MRHALGLVVTLAIAYGLVAFTWNIGEDVGRKAQLSHDRQCVADASTAQQWDVWRAVRDCVGENVE